MQRHATVWRHLLSTCGILSAVFCVAGLAGNQTHRSEVAVAGTEAPASGLTERQVSAPESSLERRAPEKAYRLLDALKRRNGNPLPGYVGGKPFQNRERRLPNGRYKEYDVNRRVPGHSRDAERLVIEQDSGKAYYTDDHYRTFVPLD